MASSSKKALDEKIKTDKRQPSRKQPVFIEELNDTDIIMGRGKYADSFPGNIGFRRIVEPLKVEYACIQRKDKVEFAQAIIQKVMEMKPPGRFVERSATTNEGAPDVHVEVDTERVIRKVLQALRQQKRVPTKKRKHPPKTQQVKTVAVAASRQRCPLALLQMLPETNDIISGLSAVPNTSDQFYPETNAFQPAFTLENYREYFASALPFQNAINDHEDTMMADLLSDLQTCDYDYDWKRIRGNVASDMETLDDNASPSQMADAIVRDVMMAGNQAAFDSLIAVTDSELELDVSGLITTSMAIAKKKTFSKEGNS